MAKSKLGEKLKSKGVQPTTGAAQPPHLIVEARAGTGKTTTLLQGLRLVFGQQPTLTPSPQQKAVWDSMALSAGQVKSCAFVAFNRSIATELKSKVPTGVDAMTNHGMGFKAVLKSFPGVKVDEYRVDGIIADLLGYYDDTRACRKDNGSLVSGVKELVGLCKMNLTDPTPEALTELVEQYGLELECSTERAFELVPQVLERCKDVATDRKIDFDDMIWLPVALDLPVYRYDLLLVDEAQDLNRCQQALIKRAGKRLILCGDPKQAIYGFAGADSESMPRMSRELEGCVTLPLTVTRRCGKAIVREAQKLVPDFEAFEANGDGQVTEARYNNDPQRPGSWYRDQVRAGDMVLCRVNSPLVTECFALIRRGVKANIQGRDIGRGLIKLCEKLVPDPNRPTVELIQAIERWQDSEMRKETAKKNPSATKIQAIEDRADCLQCFCQQVAATDPVNSVLDKINSVFTDDKTCPGVRFSSIHKAKGLEADTVYFINTEKACCPHPMAKTPAAREQEHNLFYVAVTRAIHKLVFVR